MTKWILILILSINFAAQAQVLKVALFTGTFDPPHKGHSLVVDQALNMGGMDVVIVAANPESPHKPSASAYEHRHKMLQLNFKNAANVKVYDTASFNFTNKNWFIKMLEHIQKQYPSAEIYQLVGADALNRYTDGLLKDLPIRTGLLIAGRDSEKLNLSTPLVANSNKVFIPGVIHNESSSAVRSSFKSKPFPALLHPKVNQYIIEQKLYLQPCLELLYN